MQMNDLIADTQTAIAEYEQAGQALQGVILGQGFVVRCEGLYLTFDVDQTGRVSNPQPSQPHRARRFTRADATTVAACIKNGNGAAGEVVHVRQAIAESLEGQRFLLSRLQEHNINTTPEQYSIDIK